MYIFWEYLSQFNRKSKNGHKLWVLSTCFYIQLLLIAKKTTEVHETLSAAGQLIETYNGTPLQKDSLKVFFFVLQVCHYLMAGQVCILSNKIRYFRITMIIQWLFFFCKFSKSLLVFFIKANIKKKLFQLNVDWIWCIH